MLSVSGFEQEHTAKVRAYVSKFQSSAADPAPTPYCGYAIQYNYSKTQLWMAVMLMTFVTSCWWSALNWQKRSRQLSLVSRDYIEEMASENAFLRWDGAPAEMARLGQKWV